MKIRVILVMSLVVLGSSAASAEPLFSPMFAEAAPPRPPKLIEGSASHRPHLPTPRSGRAATPAHKPSAVAPASVNPNAVTIGAPARARVADPTPTGSPNAPSFPPVQILE